jgi:hypothetical protein
MKITAEAPRKKTLSYSALGANLTGILKPIAPDRLSVLNVVVTMIGRVCQRSRFPADGALCGGAHPANYKGCDVYRRLQTAGAILPPDQGVLILARPLHTLTLATLITSLPCHTLTPRPTPQTPLHLFPCRRLRIPDH